MSRSVLALCVTGVLIGCGAPTKVSHDFGLIQAQHVDCGVEGNRLASYLDTGQPTSNDLTYGDYRQQALSLRGEQRSLYIRQAAGAYIQRCDQQKTEQEQAAQAKAERDAARAAEQALAAKEKATCGSVGGTWGPVDPVARLHICRIDYKGTDGATYHYTISFDSSGNVTPRANGPQNATQCATYYGALLTGHWHPDTAVCSL